MKQDHRPWDMHTSQGGANTDAEAENVARTPGKYINGKNMRLSANEGSDGDADKIGGETIFHGPNVPGGNTYRCIGAIKVKQWKVKFWASTQPQTFAPCITVDGIVMVHNAVLPYVWNKKLQLHSSWECGGGTVFDARSESIPLHWDIGDIVRAYNAVPQEQTYFSGLNLGAYQVNPTRQVNRPLFKGFVPVGGGGGVLPGQIWYSTRYVNDNGDRTPLSPPVGPVEVPLASTTAGLPNGVPAMPTSGIAGVDQGTVGQPSGLGVSLVVRSNNQANFQSLEVVATQYTLNGGIDAVPEIRIALRVPVQPGVNTILPLLDIGATLDEIPSDENSLKPMFIMAANSVRYVSYRVWYGGVVLGKRDMTAPLVAGTPLVPITKDIGIKGHSDPVNHCYYRRFQSNERYGVGVVYLDASGGDSFVQPIAEVDMPSRRDEKTGDSLAWSNASCFAANVFNQVTPTFEVFDHDTAVGRTQTGQVVNIMENGARRAGSGFFPNQAVAPFGLNPNENFPPYGFNNGGLYYSGPNLKTSYGKPLRPCAPSDDADRKFGLDYLVNTHVLPEGTPDATNQVPYNPRVFNVRHHTLGLGFRGLMSAPVGAQGFSLVATRPAGRVVGQALFKWKMYNAPGVDDQPQKELFQGLLCIPDFNSGIINQEVWEGMQNSPSQYKLKFVSPLGLATDQYGSVMAQNFPSVFVSPQYQDATAYSTIADILSYARVLWDTGQINPGNNSGGSTPTTPIPGNPDHFVNFGSWRGTQGPGPFGTSEGGNRNIGILSAQEFVHTSGIRSMVVNMADQIYTTISCGPTFPGANDFNNPNVKNFHEPWYVVNIIQDGAVIEPNAGYAPHNHYQAFVVDIGTTTGISNETFPLVDENQDLISNAQDGIERYIWVLNSDGLRPWLNSTPFWADYTTIQNSLATLGYWDTPAGVRIYGTFQLSFNGTTGDASVELTGTPPVGSVIQVRYRFGTDALPSYMFGDMITSPAMATMVDDAATANPTANVESVTLPVPGTDIRYPRYSSDWYTLGNQVLRSNGLPIPFANYRYNDRYMVPFGMGFGGVSAGAGYAVNQFAHGMIKTIRQWKVIFDCEVRTPLYLSKFEANGDRSWPQTHYVPRPFNFYFGNSLTANGVHQNYGDPTQYPGENTSLWQFGGIKSSQFPLPDYAVPFPIQYFKKPEFGYEEEEVQCNLLVYSEKDSPLIQDSPGLKTFPVSNQEFIENDTGKIQRLFSSNGVIMGTTERGAFEVYVEKSIAYSDDGTSFSLYAQTNAVGTVIFRSKNIGMPGRTWETAAEGAPELNGSRPDAFFWSDLRSAYMWLQGGPPTDIGEGYRKEIRSFLGNGPADFMSGFYDQSKDEFGFGAARVVVRQVIDNVLVERIARGLVLVFGASPKVKAWMGSFDYAMDDYLYYDEGGGIGTLFGARALTTYKMDDGWILNGQDINAWLEVPSAPFPGQRMEWMRIKVNSPRKPLAVEFYNEDGILVSRIDAQFSASLGQPNWTYLKKVTVWEGMVPRNRFTDGNRLQGRVASYRIIFEAEGADKVIFSGVQVKPLV